MRDERVIAWAEQPKPRQFVPIVSVKPGKPLVVCVAGPPLGVYAHFFDGRSLPCCRVAAKPCQWCKTQQPRWKGFLPARLKSGAKRIVEVTEGAMTSRENPRFRDLVGRWVRFYRSGTAANSPLWMALEDCLPPRPEIQPFDAKPSVLNMWGLLEGEDLLERHQGNG